MFKKEKAKTFTKEDMRFLAGIQKIKLPILTLDPNWHALFVNANKTPEIKALEKELTALLKKEARLTGDNKAMQAHKKMLMGQIIHRMSEEDDASHVQKRKQREMIEDINTQVMENEDELEFLPKRIQHVNEELLLETLKVVYYQIDSNRQRSRELEEEIGQLRLTLSHKLLEKQNCEEYNQGIFGQLKLIMGREAFSLYDDTHPLKEKRE